MARKSQALVWREGGVAIPDGAARLPSELLRARLGKEGSVLPVAAAAAWPGDGLDVCCGSGRSVWGCSGMAGYGTNHSICISRR